MNLTDVERRLLRRFGPDVSPWLADLSARLDKLAHAWDLELAEPFGSGNSAVTVRASRAGIPVVLKVSPDVETARAQTRVLRAFGPSGRVPQVLAADDGAMLLEHLDGTPHWPDPAEFAALLSDLHTAVPDAAPIARGDLSSGVPTFLDRARPAGPITADDLATSRARCAAMVASTPQTPTYPHPPNAASEPNPHPDNLAAGGRTPTPVLLHGDLHRDNVLSGVRAVAIDPHGTLGEPEFDAVDYVLDGPDIGSRRDALVAVSDLRPDRLEGWCHAVAAVVALGAHRNERPTCELLDYARSAPRSR